MTKDKQGRYKKYTRLWLALALLVVILAVLVVPPLVSVSRYKSRITQLMAASLGRPVRLSSVELRLLPRPGFLLTDLTVEEDPAYGAEPVLHANSVTASIRLLSLWRGKLEIGRISVDEASLNLVRTGTGRWNLDTLFRNAAVQSADREHPVIAYPYLDATNSRINIKDGAEKLPFSLVNADLSFWQENSGDWRIRLRGQPARTDVSLDSADTGVVRLEATVHRAPKLRQMPVHVDLEWREAQLGQLTRLVIGSDPGWRGDLTGELHLDGTAEAAQVKTRLRASNVHRAEFAPAAPLDFDANCGFVYHYSGRTFEKLVCDSPLGDGHVRLAGDLRGEGVPPHFSVELDRIPVQAGLDALRTVRSGFGPGLEAKGSISGKITYAEDAAAQNMQETPVKTSIHGRSRLQKPRPAQGPLTGSFTVEGFQLSGDGLSKPIRLAKASLDPVNAPVGQPQGLTATVAIPSGAPTPLAVTAQVGLSGYKLTVRGPANLARAKELAHVAGVGNAAILDPLSGDAVAMDLSAEGPWVAGQRLSMGSAADPEATADRVSGTVTVRNASWKANYLASPVEIAQATLHLGGPSLLWDSVAFAYGPVKGTARLELPAACEAPQTCPPRFEVQFGVLNAAVLQSAVLGAHQQGTLLSTLIARLRPAAAPAWPQLEGTVKADSLILGPVTLREASATLRLAAGGIDITSLEAGLLGGQIHASGTLHSAGNAGTSASAPGSTSAGATDAGSKPSYSLQGTFEKLSPSAMGQLVGLRWSGGVLSGNGRVDLSGFTEKDLSESAKGSLHFDWRHGSVGGPSTLIPSALTRFDRWAADAEIGNGAVTLQQNQVQRGVRKSTVGASVTLGDLTVVTFTPSKEAVAAKR